MNVKITCKCGQSIEVTGCESGYTFTCPSCNIEILTINPESKPPVLFGFKNPCFCCENKNTEKAAHMYNQFFVCNECFKEMEPVWGLLIEIPKISIVNNIKPISEIYNIDAKKVAKLAQLVLMFDRYYEE